MVKKKSEFIKLMEKGEVDDSYDKRGYKIPSLSRSRLGKKGNNKPIKAGAAAQRDFLKFLTNALGDIKDVSISIDGSERIPIKEIKKRLN